MEPYLLPVHLSLVLVSVPIILSNCKNINSVFIGLKHLKR